MKKKEEDRAITATSALNLSLPRKALVLGLSIILVLAVGVADYLTGYEIYFSIFYLIPVSIAVYFTGFGCAAAVSVLSAVTWLIADIYVGHVYQHVLIPIWNMFIMFGYFLLHSFIFSRLPKFYYKTKMDSLTDPLTQIMNSRYFYEQLERELKRSERSGRPFTLAYLDLDNFKFMNDTYGHPAGDQLLKKLSRLIRDNIRSPDLFARMGGDEFILLFPETDRDPSSVMIARINDIFSAEMKKNGWPVTLSIGAVTFRKFDKTVGDVIKMADDAMYGVKKDGKDRIRHITAE